MGFPCSGTTAKCTHFHDHTLETQPWTGPSWWVLRICQAKNTTLCELIGFLLVLTLLSLHTSRCSVFSLVAKLSDLWVLKTPGSTLGIHFLTWECPAVTQTGAHWVSPLFQILFHTGPWLVLQNPGKQKPLPLPCRWGEWGTEWLNDPLRVMPLVNNQDWMYAWSQNPFPFFS